MSEMVSQIISLTIVYSTVYSRRRSKKTSKLRVTGLCVGNSPVTGGFPAQMTSNAENISIWWRHYVRYVILTIIPLKISYEYTPIVENLHKYIAFTPKPGTDFAPDWSVNAIFVDIYVIW